MPVPVAPFSNDAPPPASFGGRKRETKKKRGEKESNTDHHPIVRTDELAFTEFLENICQPFSHRIRVCTSRERTRKRVFSGRTGTFKLNRWKAIMLN